MTYVIAVSRMDIKDRACVEECPVDCIREGARGEASSAATTPTLGPDQVRRLDTALGRRAR